MQKLKIFKKKKKKEEQWQDPVALWNCRPWKTLWEVIKCSHRVDEMTSDLPMSILPFQVALLPG